MQNPKVQFHPGIRSNRQAPRVDQGPNTLGSQPLKSGRLEHQCLMNLRRLSAMRRSGLSCAE